MPNCGVLVDISGDVEAVELATVSSLLVAVTKQSSPSPVVVQLHAVIYVILTPLILEPSIGTPRKSNYCPYDSEYNNPIGVAAQDC